MPRGKPKKGYRRGGAGRPKGRAVMSLVVVGARSGDKAVKKAAAMVKLTLKAKVMVAPWDGRWLQLRLNGMDDGQLNEVWQFLRPELGSSFHDAEEVNFDMDRLSVERKKELSEFVEGICASAAQIHEKVSRLRPCQVAEVISFIAVLAPDLAQTQSGGGEFKLNWDGFGRKGDLVAFLDQMLKQ